MLRDLKMRLKNNKARTQLRDFVLRFYYPFSYKENLLVSEETELRAQANVRQVYQMQTKELPHMFASMTTTISL